ncbi:putative Calcineurin like phosphoesterase [Trypanosoma vivax]|nr:protein phosphatase 2A catalytic subunit [Trypanosoma vivax]KAH8605051.1 putative Calcineurin like phosphoesterase [Trypanosoma vivax]
MDTIDQFLETVSKGVCPRESEVMKLCSKARSILNEESNTHVIRAPCTIVGDIHAQFFDLIEMFRVGGDVPDVNYVFMGDYVDRGHHGVETFLLLLALKVKYTSRVALLRGNHESRQITQVYGFYDECLRKYGSVNVWRYCTDVFDLLPLVCVVEEKILCVHAGLSPMILTVNQMETIERRCEVPHEGAMCDLLWSDPEEIEGWGISPRGAGYLYGEDVVRTFLETNNLDLLCRSHQLVMEGYKVMFNDTLVTVWSAPNYCYRCMNVASILELDEHLNKNFKLFEAAPDEARESSKPSVPDYFL